MFTIEEHPHLLLHALENGLHVHYTKLGDWRYDRWIIRKTRRLMRKEGRYLPVLIKRFISLLDRWEHHPLTFVSDGILSENDLGVTTLYLAIGRKLLVEFQKTNYASDSLLSCLYQRLLALEYRAGLHSGRVLDSMALTQLEDLAVAWKQKQFIFAEYAKLTPLDRQRLTHLNQYAEYAALILSQENLRERFFNWVFVTRNSTDVFVEFPAMAELLIECQLASHLGYYEGRLLRVSLNPIKKGEQTQKELQCLFECMHSSEWHSILNSKSTVRLKKDYVISIEQVFDDFRNKDYAWGNVWLFEAGISNWHAGKLARYNGRMGRFDAIQLTECWWEKLPLMKWMSFEEVSRLYPYLELDQGQSWIGRNVATRRSFATEIYGNHAYREIYIPYEKEGRAGYRIFTFCLYPTTFPREWHEYLPFAASTWEGTITCPDPSIFYMNRQRAGIAFKMTLKEAEKVMEDIKWDIQQGRNGNLAYQILIHNCAKWSTFWRSILGPEKVPTMLYRTTFDRSEPPGFWGVLFKIVKRLPEAGKDYALSGFFMLLGGKSTRKIVTKGGRTLEVSLLNPRLKPWLRGRYYGIPSVIFDTVSSDLSKEHETIANITRGC